MVVETLKLQEGKMKVKFSPFFIVGVTILVVYFIVDNLITTIPAKFAVPVLLFALVLIIIDGIRRRVRNGK